MEIPSSLYVDAQPRTLLDNLRVNSSIRVLVEELLSWFYLPSSDPEAHLDETPHGYNPARVVRDVDPTVNISQVRARVTNYRVVVDNSHLPQFLVGYVALHFLVAFHDHFSLEAPNPGSPFPPAHESVNDYGDTRPRTLPLGSLRLDNSLTE